MPIQIIAKPMSRNSRKPRTPSRTLVRIRQPIVRPVSAITVMPMLEWIRLDRLRPTRIAERWIGSALSRSTNPFSRSVDQPHRDENDEKMIVCAMIPGTRNSR